MNLRTIENLYARTKSYIERNGLSDAVIRTGEGIKDSINDYFYNHEMQSMTEHADMGCMDEADEPYKISLLIPAYNTDHRALRRLLNSLSKQSYRNFEAIIADASDDDSLIELVEEFRTEDENNTRLIYTRLKENKGISENTNEALKCATGDFVVAVDHDDFLAENALFSAAAALRDGSDIVYTDEDKYDPDEDRYFCPNRKPDFNKDLLLSNNYICHLFLVRKTIADKVGGFRKEFDGAQDYDFIIRCCESTSPEKIAHVGEVLYHWCVSEGSTADNPMSKLYAYESGKKVLEKYLESKNIQAEVTDTKHRGFYRINYEKNLLDKDEYCFCLDKKLIPLTDDYEETLASYLIRDDVGAVGGRVIGKLGNIICNGYREDSCGRRMSLYGKMHTRLSGYMHRAAMQQDVEAVSLHACVVRRSLMKYYDKDPMKMFARIRKEGYLVIVDPEVEFMSRK